MAQITGRDLKVGDRVRAALEPLGPRNVEQDRRLGTMDGTIIKIYPNAHSGGMGKNGPTGRIKVQWASGSVGVHDSIMIVKVG
jgi:hypothetical protein